MAEDTTAKDVPVIMEALHQVMVAVPYIQKDATNQHFKYQYVSEGAVLGAVRKAMLDAGLFLIPQITATHVEDGGRATVNLEFTLVHKSGAVWPWPIHWVGMGADNQDKAIAKAATSGVKYFLLKFLAIETGTDPDKDGDQREAAARPQQSGAARQPQASKSNQPGHQTKKTGVLKDGSEEANALYDELLTEMQRIRDQGDLQEFNDFRKNAAPDFKRLPKRMRDLLIEFRDECVRVLDTNPIEGEQEGQDGGTE